MYGRIAQHRYPIEYAEALGQMPIGGLSPEPIGRYNVPTQSMVQLLHQDEDGLRMEPVKMGRRPFLGAGEKTASDQCQGRDRSHL